MNKLAIGMLAALAAGLGQAAVTVGTGEKVSAAAEDYVLEGGTLVFETPGQAFGGWDRRFKYDWRIDLKDGAAASHSIENGGDGRVKVVVTRPRAAYSPTSSPRS